MPTRTIKETRMAHGYEQCHDDPRKQIFFWGVDNHPENVPKHYEACKSQGSGDTPPDGGWLLSPFFTAYGNNELEVCKDDS